jgi:hypothetical protein
MGRLSRYHETTPYSSVATFHETDEFHKTSSHGESAEALSTLQQSRDGWMAPACLRDKVTAPWGSPDGTRMRRYQQKDDRRAALYEHQLRQE